MKKLKIKIDPTDKSIEEIGKELKNYTAAIGLVKSIESTRLNNINPLLSAENVNDRIVDGLTNPVYYANHQQLLSLEPIVVLDDSFYTNMNRYYTSESIGFTNQHKPTLDARRDILIDTFANRFDFMVINAAKLAGDGFHIDIDQIKPEYKVLSNFINSCFTIKDLVYYITSLAYNRQYSRLYNTSESNISEMESRCELFAKYLYNNLNSLYVEACLVYFTAGSTDEYIESISDFAYNQSEFAEDIMIKLRAKELGVKIPSHHITQEVVENFAKSIGMRDIKTTKF